MAKAGQPTSSKTKRGSGNSSTKKPISISKLKNAVQARANLYARLRDCFGALGTNCISCGVWKDFSELDGGHFIPTTSSDIRFDERNINAQCTRCNRFLHGNPRHYYKGMLRKFGKDVVDDLESREFQSKKWTREELLAIRTYYNDKIKCIERGEPPTPFKANTGLAVPDVFANMGKTG